MKKRKYALFCFFLTGGHIVAVIGSENFLQELLPRLENADWIAVDTEADSLHAYPEKLCLIQISFAGADELIDPLAGLDLAPLWRVLRTHELILHGADYDLRLLRKTQNFIPGRIFDTMLAARLLGCPEFGLSHLLSKYLNVVIEKGSQKADWARRPLTSRMEQYARNDTRYLQPLANLLRQELKVKNRLEWHSEMCAWLVRECAVPPSPDFDEIWRIKGSYRLDRAGLAVLRELWGWREEEATAANKPPYFILSHELLVDLAAGAANSADWRKLIPRHLFAARRQSLEQAIARGLRVEPSHHPEIRQSVSRRPNLIEKRRFEDLRARRDREAKHLGIDPTLIASRSVLALLAHDRERYQDDLMRWQKDLLIG